MYFLYSLNPRSDALAIAKKESETHNKAAIGSIKIKIKAATDVKITNNVVIQIFSLHKKLVLIILIQIAKK